MIQEIHLKPSPSDYETWAKATARDLGMPEPKVFRPNKLALQLAGLTPKTMFNPKIKEIKDKIAALEIELTEARANPDFTPEDLFLHFFPLETTKVNVLSLDIINFINGKNYIAFSPKDKYVFSESQGVKDTFEDEYGMSGVRLARFLSAQIAKHYNHIF